MSDRSAFLKKIKYQLRDILKIITIFKGVELFKTE